MGSYACYFTAFTSLLYSFSFFISRHSSPEIDPRLRRHLQLICIFLPSKVIVPCLSLHLKLFLAQILPIVSILHTYFFKNVFVLSSQDRRMTLESIYSQTAVSKIMVSSMILNHRIIWIELHFKHGFKNDHLNIFLQNIANVFLCIFLTSLVQLLHLYCRRMRQCLDTPVICTNFSWMCQPVII